MALQNLFHCPNCNAALDLANNNAPIVRCDYCHSVVIVPESIRQRVGLPSQETPAPKKPPKPKKPKLTEKEAVAKVTELVRNGRKIEAMKLYRETYNIGLKEAKDAVEQAASGLPLPIPELRQEEEEMLPTEAAENITHLVALGQLEEAAHLYRITFGTSHIEADTAVQQLADGKSIDTARHRARTETQATAVRREVASPAQQSSTRFWILGIVLFTLVVLAVIFGLVAFLFG